MPKPGYITNIDDLGLWFNSPAHSDLNRFEIRDTNDVGKILIQYEAPSHVLAWESCQQTLNLFHGGLFWVRFFVGKGSQAGVGLDLSPINTQNTPHVGNITGLATMDAATQQELWEYRYKAAQKKKEGIAGFFLEMFNTPESKKEIAEGIKGFMNSLTGKFDNFSGGAGIKGISSDEAVAYVNSFVITEPTEKIIDCKMFMLHNLSNGIVYIDGAPLLQGSNLSFDAPNKRFKQKFTFGKDENVDMRITLIMID